MNTLSTSRRQGDIAAPVAPGSMADDLPPPTGSRIVLWVMVAGLAGLVVWADNVKIDQVTRAPAQIIVSKRTQLVQSPDGGVVTALHVKEGDTVHAGQLLVTLQKERAEAAVNDSDAKVAALRITLARLRAEVYGKPLVFDANLQKYSEYIENQTELYTKRRTAYLDDAKALEDVIRLADAELTINQKLEVTGDVSRAEVLRLQRSVADSRAQQVNRRNKYFQDAQAEMTKAQEDLSTQTEQLRDRQQVLDHTELTAPIDGIVNNIKVNTIGGVARAGETVMELMATGNQLVAEAKVTPTDIPWVSLGQNAHVKIDAYDSSIFGSMIGKVTYISPDVITEETPRGPTSYYRVWITITGTEFDGDRAQDMHLRPGLTGSVDIKALDRTVLSYLTKPITKTLKGGLGER